eukprot:4867642-Pleurochrysis_carterae.AAC.3
MATSVTQVGIQREEREIGDLAVWSLSTAKPGNGVEQLRDDNIETYWQYVHPELQPSPMHEDDITSSVVGYASQSKLRDGLSCLMFSLLPLLVDVAVAGLSAVPIDLLSLPVLVGPLMSALGAHVSFHLSSAVCSRCSLSTKRLAKLV